MSNPLFSRIKIGRSSKDPTQDRLKQLNGETGTAEKYKCEYYAFVGDENGLETSVHRELADRRVHKEFFEISILEAIDTIREHSDNYGGIKYEEVYFKSIHESRNSDGSLYVGETNGGTYGQPHGYGTLTAADGTIRYKGQYKNGKFHGKGFNHHLGKLDKEKQDSYSYDGDYTDGKRHGYGVYKFYSKSISENKEGITHETKLRVTRDGEWRDDEFIKGVAYFSDGSKYEGNFHAYLLHGKGVFIDAKGASYEGFYKNGERHGDGVEWNSKGDKFAVKYENNKQIKCEPLDQMSDLKKWVLGGGVFFLLMWLLDQ